VENDRAGLTVFLIYGLRLAKRIPYRRGSNNVMIGNQAASSIPAKCKALSHDLFPPYIFTSGSTKAEHARSPGGLIAGKGLLGKQVFVAWNRLGMVEDFAAVYRASQPPLVPVWQ